MISPFLFFRLTSVLSVCSALSPDEAMRVSVLYIDFPSGSLLLVLSARLREALPVWLVAPGNYLLAQPSVQLTTSTSVLSHHSLETLSAGA